MTGLRIFCLISKPCAVLPAQMFMHSGSLPPTTAPSCLFPQLQFPALVPVTGTYLTCPKFSSCEHTTDSCQPSTVLTSITRSFPCKRSDSEDFKRCRVGWEQVLLSVARRELQATQGHTRLVHKGLKYNS